MILSLRFQAYSINSMTFDKKVIFEERRSTKKYEDSRKYNGNLNISRVTGYPLFDHAIS